MPDTLNTFGNLTATASGPVTVIPTPVVYAPDTLILLCGGLGSNQFLQPPSLSDFLAKELPQERVFITHVSDSFPGYVFGRVPNIEGIILQARKLYSSIRTVITIGHSMAWATIAIAGALGFADAIVAVDPVGLPGVSRVKWPRIPGDGLRVPGLFLKARPTFGIAQLYIEDGPEITEYLVDHNQITHDPAAWQQISAFVRAAMGDSTKGQVSHGS
jgi:hypothetical protein